MLGVSIPRGKVLSVRALGKAHSLRRVLTAALHCPSALRAKSLSEVIALGLGPQATGPFWTELVSTARCLLPSSCALSSERPGTLHARHVPLRSELPVCAGGGWHRSLVRRPPAQPGPAPLDPPLDAEPGPGLRPAPAQGLYGLALLRRDAALVSSGEQLAFPTPRYSPFSPGSHWTLPGFVACPSRYPRSIHCPRLRPAAPSKGLPSQLLTLVG